MKVTNLNIVHENICSLDDVSVYFKILDPLFMPSKSFVSMMRVSDQFRRVESGKEINIAKTSYSGIHCMYI